MNDRQGGTARVPAKCRFRFVCRRGRGKSRRAVYVCVVHAYLGCLPYAIPVKQ